MLDRLKLEMILRRRFPEATHPEVAAAANAIMKLGEESLQAEPRSAGPTANPGPEVKPGSVP